MPAFSPVQAWYKTLIGKILIVILVLIGLLLLSFGSLVGYYALQIRAGNTQAILESIRSSKFTTGLDIEAPGENRENRIDSEKLIHSHTPILGPDDAPITIVTFIDFECPFCQQAYLTTKNVFETYAPVVRIVFKHFPLASIHPLAYQAGEAAACANDQGKFWEYYDTLFTQQVFSTTALESYARDLSLDLNTFRTCTDDNIHRAAMDQDFRDGVSAGVLGTPTYFINGRKVEGVITREQWDAILIEALDQ